MDATQTSRFARYEEGRIVALVAEGLPEWPTDAAAEAEFLAGLTDTQVGELHDALATEAADLSARLSAGDADVDLDRAEAVAARITTLRAEAQRRMAAAEGGEGDGGGAGTGEGEGEGAGGEGEGEGSAGDGEGEGNGGEGADDQAAARRAAAAASLAGLQDPVIDPALIEVPGVDPTEMARAMAEGQGRSLAPVLDAMRRSNETMATALERLTSPAVPRRHSAGDLGGFRSPHAAPPEEGTTPPRTVGTLVHTGDVPEVAPGHQFTSVTELARAFRRRHRDIGQAVADDEKVQIASFRYPEGSLGDRDLRGIDEVEMRRRIAAVVGPEAIGRDPYNLSRELPISRGGIAVTNDSALVASGGLAAPVEPYYPQLCLADASRPVAGAMPSFVFERGGIKLVQPATISTLAAATVPGEFADGVSTDGSENFVSATAAFTGADVGSAIVEMDGGGHIPAGTVITGVTNGTTVVLSQDAVGAATGITFRIANRNPNNLGGAVGVVTAAQDAAGPPQTVKFTYDVPIGSQIEHDVYSIYTSLQFANLTARTFPEQVELNIRLANALAARVAEEQALNYITGWSTLFTGAKTFGTARQLLAQLEHMAAFYRNDQRMDPAAVLRVGIPAWAINAMRGDYISTFMGGKSEWGLSDDELNAWFGERHLLPFFYWDGATDVSQLFATPGSGAVNTGGVNNATPIAIPDYPGTGVTSSFRTKIVTYMWGEGTWIFGSTGELNVGLVRDSILNSQNRFRNFEEAWETPAFVGSRSLRCVHTVAADGTYGAAASVTLGAGSGL